MTKKWHKKQPNVQVNCVTEKGGSVVLNEEHGVWASYAVASGGDIPPSEIFYAGIKMPDGKNIQFFCNRESGLVTVNIINKKCTGGNEICRIIVDNVKM